MAPPLALLCLVLAVVLRCRAATHPSVPPTLKANSKVTPPDPAPNQRPAGHNKLTKDWCGVVWCACEGIE